jgi:acyl-CoA reductase-like NAD-dependent aldehyde dehydrogenase
VTVRLLAGRSSTIMKTEQIQHHRNFIGGEWVPASGGARYAIHNPARPRECLGEFADSTEADVAAAIDSARSAADA